METKDEIQNRYDFLRNLFQVFVTWFTVFCVLNVTAVGWIALNGLTKEKPQSKLTNVVDNITSKIEISNPGMVWLLTGMFISANLLALTACVYLHREFRSTNERLSTLISKEKIATPQRFYLTATVLIGLSCSTYLITWIVVPFIIS